MIKILNHKKRKKWFIDSTRVSPQFNAKRYFINYRNKYVFKVKYPIIIHSTTVQSNRWCINIKRASNGLYFFFSSKPYGSHLTRSQSPNTNIINTCSKVSHKTHNTKPISKIITTIRRVRER